MYITFHFRNFIPIQHHLVWIRLSPSTIKWESMGKLAARKHSRSRLLTSCGSIRSGNSFWIKPWTGGGEEQEKLWAWAGVEGSSTQLNSITFSCRLRFIRERHKALHCRGKAIFRVFRISSRRNFSPSLRLSLVTISTVKKEKVNK